MGVRLQPLHELEAFSVPEVPGAKIGVDQAEVLAAVVRERSLPEDLEIIAQRWSRFDDQARALLAPLFAPSTERLSLYFAGDYVGARVSDDVPSRHADLSEAPARIPQELDGARIDDVQVSERIGQLMASSRSIAVAHKELKKLLSRWEDLTPKARQILISALSPRVLRALLEQDRATGGAAKRYELQLEAAAGQWDAIGGLPLEDRMRALAEREGLAKRSLTMEEAMRLAGAAINSFAAEASQYHDVFLWMVRIYGPASPDFMGKDLPRKLLKQIGSGLDGELPCEIVARYLAFHSYRREQRWVDAAEELMHAADALRFLGDSRALRSNRLAFYSLAKRLCERNLHGSDDERPEALLHQIDRTIAALTGRALSEGVTKAVRRQAHFDIDEELVSNARLIAGEIPKGSFAELLSRIERTQGVSARRFAHPSERPRTIEELRWMNGLLAEAHPQLYAALRETWLSEDFERWSSSTPATRQAALANPAPEMTPVLRLVHATVAFSGEEANRLLPREAMRIEDALEIAYAALEVFEAEQIFPTLAAALMRSSQMSFFEGGLSEDAYLPREREAVVDALALYLQARMMVDHSAGVRYAGGLLHRLAIAPTARGRIHETASRFLEEAGDRLEIVEGKGAEVTTELRELRRIVYAMGAHLLEHRPEDQQRLRAKRSRVGEITAMMGISYSSAVTMAGGFYTVRPKDYAFTIDHGAAMTFQGLHRLAILPPSPQIAGLVTILPQRVPIFAPIVASHFLFR